MKIIESKTLHPYNSFHINAKTNYYLSLNKIEDIKNFLQNEADNYKKMPWLILGEGSNVLFTKDYSGLVLHPNIKGIEAIKQNNEFVWIKAYAGEKWDDVVKYSVEHGYGGLENLSYIPGKVGACPVQNIGAYGVEVSDTIEQVETISIEDGSLYNFSNKACVFEYRNSIFKNAYKNQLIIISVIFKLRKKPVFVLEYGNLSEKINHYGSPNLKNIRQAVIDIRKRKLPDIDKIGNAGSFFKNPVVKKEIAQYLQNKYPELPVYKTNGDCMKISAAWMIDQCGWKGYRENDAGVHDKHALILVNYGNASGKNILDMAKKIKASVNKRFGQDLDFEVNII